MEVAFLSAKKLSKMHEDVMMPDQDFPVRAFYYEYNIPGGLFDLHWHEHFELIYVVSGSMEIECEGRMIHLGPEELIVINPNELHSCPHIETPLKLYCVIFDVEILKSRFFDKSESKYIQPIMQNGILFENQLLKNEVMAAHIMNVCKELELQGRGYELAVKADILYILVILLRGHVVRILTSSEREAKIKNNGRIRAALDYIDSHYTEEITVDTVAEAIYVSKFYLCKLFKKNLGQTVIEYVHDVRIMAARKLLEQSDDSISQIAYKVGFNDFNYFSRVYKKKMKETPSDTRKKLKN